MFGIKQAIGLEPPKAENQPTGPLPQHFADEFGWEDMAREVGRVYNALPPEQRAKTAIFANSYGQAGAIDFFGKKYGLPKAISNHQNYWYWGPRDYTGESVIVLGSDGSGDREHFASVESMGRTYHPYSRRDEHFEIFVCRDLNTPLSALWPEDEEVGLVFPTRRRRASARPILDSGQADISRFGTCRSTSLRGWFEHPMESTAAILLRKRKLSDTSLIISWCTESLGCIQTVARGARRAKSPFAGKLDLFFEAEIQISRSRKSDLHTLTEVALRNPFGGIRENFRRTQAASYFVELIEICTESDHHEPELFALLRRAFTYLSEKDPNLKAVLHFETELARIAGVHDTKMLKSDPALALANLFGRLPTSRADLRKSLAVAMRKGNDNVTIAHLPRRVRLNQSWPMKSSRFLFALGLGLVVGGSSVRANEIFKFDSAHSTIAFKVRHMIGSAKGKFTKFSGTIEVDREHPEKSSVVATIQAASIDTANAKRDEHLRTADFFNVQKYPEITFKSRRVKQTGPNAGEIVGDLSMHGVTRAITLKVQLLGDSESAAKSRDNPLARDHGAAKTQRLWDWKGRRRGLDDRRRCHSRDRNRSSPRAISAGHYSSSRLRTLQERTSREKENRDHR